jgi:hypothetical protein
LTEVLGGPRTLIRPLAQKDGFAVVREDRGTVENRYATDLVARVMEGPRPHLSFEPYGPKAVAVEASFQTQLGRVSGAQLSSALVKVVESLSGTRLRPTGAIYWIPGPRLADWADVGQAVEAAADGAPSAVYLIKHRLDGEAVRAIRDAVVAEVSAEATRIREDVAAGDLGGRALETRKQQAADLRSKVLLYEDLLSVGLDGLHRAVDDADQAAATASLLLSAQVPPCRSRRRLIPPVRSPIVFPGGVPCPRRGSRVTVSPATASPVARPRTKKRRGPWPRPGRP